MERAILLRFEILTADSGPTKMCVILPYYWDLVRSNGLLLPITTVLFRYSNSQINNFFFKELQKMNLYIKGAGIILLSYACILTACSEKGNKASVEVNKPVATTMTDTLYKNKIDTLVAEIKKKSNEK